MTNWKDSPVFCSTKAVEYEVGGEILKFWPLSVERVFTLRALATPIAQAIVRLQPGGNDTTIIERQVSYAEGPGREVINEAIHPELAKVREAQQAKAIKELIEAVTDPKHAALIGDLLIDSLRELFPDGSKKPGGNEVLRALPAPRLIEMLRGLMKANAEVVDPLVARVVPTKATQPDQPPTE